MEPIFVRVRDCAHPESPHEEGDGVYLRPTVSLAGGLALERDMNDSLVEALARVVASGRDAKDLTTKDVNDILTPRWLETTIRYGAVSWTLTDDEGLPLGVDDIINDYNLARPVADRAADLYTDAVLVPLAERLGEPSPTGSTNGSTSRSPRPTRKPSKRSSRATSADGKRSGVPAP